MREIRGLLTWLFAFTALVCFAIALPRLLLALRSAHAGNNSLVLHRLLAPLVLSAFGGVFAVAWWASFRERPSARLWGIVASLLNILVVLSGSILRFFVLHRSFASFPISCAVGTLAVGLAGVVVFSRRDNHVDKDVATSEASG
jgi:hypothetical protein